MGYIQETSGPECRVHCYKRQRTYVLLRSAKVQRFQFRKNYKLVAVQSILKVA
jgi:hypothetical protein